MSNKDPKPREAALFSAINALWVWGALFLLCWPTAAAAQEPECHPRIDEDLPQYVVGYGSLMETASKERTAPNTGTNLPVRVRAYQRQWNARGSLVGFSTTYLGVRPVADARMVAALYRVFDPQDVRDTDEREAYYCRAAVDPAQVEMLDGSDPPGRGQIWIYVNKPDAVHPPDPRFPIVQSYVDIFLTGCFELQEKVVGEGPGFAEQCIETTAGWSRHWVNDRLYPRRPFIYQPNASRIDRLLAEKLPKLFRSIRIE